LAKDPEHRRTLAKESEERCQISKDAIRESI